MNEDIPPPPGPDDSPQTCRRCELWAQATQAVTGAGPVPAPIVLVGEQPGDEEDRRGEPFVGPAGTLLTRALLQAGLTREQVFITNAVKHFKWQARGKRRLHKTPAQQEIAACEVWLLRELAQVQPRVIVSLGATAYRALSGQERGYAEARRSRTLARDGVPLVVTWHPSAALRVPNVEMRRAIFDDIVAALKLAAQRAEIGPPTDPAAGG
ncbi:MAG: UdgX family uracil-DNA binding protein [Burkholderiaceae bacterium]|nr:UdgX family uracil-DNA binding protein [Burkholderiaceae bacterium]